MKSSFPKPVRVIVIHTQVYVYICIRTVFVTFVLKVIFLPHIRNNNDNNKHFSQTP